MNSVENSCNSAMTGDLRTSGRTLKCNFCQQKFTDKRRLMAHVWMHSVETAFGCPACDRHFATASTLAYHRRHCSFNSFICANCHLRFEGSCQLAYHKKLGRCRETFTNMESLKMGERSHDEHKHDGSSRLLGRGKVSPPDITVENKAVQPVYFKPPPQKAGFCISTGQLHFAFNQLM